MARELPRGKDPAVYYDYRDVEGADEIAFELGVEIGRFGCVTRWPVGTVINAADVHHIFSTGGTRYHVRANLIALARVPHDLFHFGARGEPAPIRTLALAAKARKAARLNDPAEWNLADADFAAGFSVRGWVERQVFEGEWEFVREFQREFLERTAS